MMLRKNNGVVKLHVSNADGFEIPEAHLVEIIHLAVMSTV